MIDADVPAFWQGLGLPGLVDVHTHFMPDRVMDAVWAYFDSASDHYGTDWPIHYRLPVDERLAVLSSLGVRHFTALLYPHKPGMGESLCRWGVSFGASTPGCVPTGTFFPEESAASYVGEALAAGARMFKAHVQVGAYDPRDSLLAPVWGQLAEAGVPVVVHCGSGPLAGQYTGASVFEEVLREHPRLTAVIAHAGSPEFLEHIDLARRYPNVHLDTTMVGVPFTSAGAPVTADVRAGFADLQDRIVLGTDFPNIPYAYAEQLEALVRWDLGDDWLRAVCWHNGLRLLTPGL